MSWGQNAQLTATSLNNFVGNRIQSIIQALEDLNDFHTGWAASNGANGVEALPAAVGGSQITQGDANTLLSAVADMASLWSVFYGNATIANGGAVTVSAGTGHDFSAFAKQGAGLAPHS